MPDQRRQCRGTNKKGQPCGRPPLTNSEWCGAHDPSIPASVRFGSPEQVRTIAVEAGKRSGEVRRKLSLLESLRRELDERQAEVFTPHWVAIRQATSKVAEALERGEDVPREDLELAMRAVDRLVDRAIGKPMQALEVSGPAGGPVEVRESVARLPDDELDRQLSSFLAGADAGRAAEEKSPAP